MDGGKHYCKCHQALHSPDEDTPAWEREFQKEWHQHGMLFRPNDKPCVVSDTKYQLTYQWKNNWLLHRTTGPAVISYNKDEDGNVFFLAYAEYCLNGKSIPVEEFCQHYEFLWLKRYNGVFKYKRRHIPLNSHERY